MRLRTVFVRALSVAVLVLACTSCDRNASSSRQLRADDAELERMYQHMAMRYREVGATTEDQAHGQVQQMNQMHAQLVHLHGQLMMNGQGVMGGGAMMSGDVLHGMAGPLASGMDRWHQKMAQLNEQWAMQANDTGHEGLARMHRDTAELHRQAASEFARFHPDENQSATASDDQAQPDGAELFASACAACHGTNGQGVSGAFPPLVGSAMVNGDPQALIQIVRAGRMGPVEVDGVRYDGVMPPFGTTLSNAQIAALLSYIRSVWGNHAAPVTEGQVATVAQGE